jgi:hypothetical protein
LPTRERFEAAYQASQRERFSHEAMIDGAKSLHRLEETPHPQCSIEQPAESVFQEVDPLPAVHRRRNNG